MKSSRSAFIFEFQQLVNEMQASQAAFSAAYSKATRLFATFSAARGGDGERWGCRADEGRECDRVALRSDFDRSLEQPQLSLERPARDHYIEQPFLDPYDCFDDSAPEFGFPYAGRLREPGALAGLFEADPQGAIPSTPSPDVEIEYLPNGGYRMRSMPRSKRAKPGAQVPDPLDGLSF